jgi:hypothetical protein
MQKLRHYLVTLFALAVLAYVGMPGNGAAAPSTARAATYDYLLAPRLCAAPTRRTPASRGATRRRSSSAFTTTRGEGG